MVDMEADVASDLSALHRIDNMYDMGSRRWAQLVPRLIAYPGAVQFRFKLWAQRQRDAEAEQAGGGGVAAPTVSVAAPAPTPPAGPWKPDKVVPSSPVALQHSDIGDMFSFG